MSSEAQPVVVPAEANVGWSGPTPPRVAETRPRFRWWWLLAGLALGAAGWALFEFNPAGNSFYPQCSLYRLTGLLCPGCGGLRAGHQLLHGHVREAFALNSLALAALPLALWFAVEPWLRPPDRRWLPRLLTDPIAIALGLGVIAGFAVARNLPLAQWLGW